MATESEADAFSYWKKKERSKDTNARRGEGGLRPPVGLYRSRTPEPTPPRPPPPVLNSQQLFRRPLHQQPRRLSGKSVSNATAKWEAAADQNAPQQGRVTHQAIGKSNSNPITGMNSQGNVDRLVSPSQLKSHSFKLSPVPPPKRSHVIRGSGSRSSFSKLPPEKGVKTKSVSELAKMLEPTLSPKSTLEYNKKESSPSPLSPEVFVLPNRRESVDTSPVVLRRKRSDKTEESKRHSASSVNIRSSGFICYLDGPPDAPMGSQSTPSTLRGSQSTPSTLRGSHNTQFISSPLTPSVDTPKTSGMPTRNYLVECSNDSDEMGEFWEMVEELQENSASSSPRSGYLTAPVISEKLQKLSPTDTNRHGSVSVMTGKSVDIITVTMKTGRDSTEVVFQCNANVPVHSVISKGLEKLQNMSESYHNYTLSKYCLKVCGRDEYLESNHQLCDYEYVYQCQKFSSNVHLVLVEKPLSVIGKPTDPDKLAALKKDCVSLEDMNLLLNDYFALENNFRSILSSQEGRSAPIGLPALAQTLVSCIKDFCKRLSFIEAPEVTEAVFNFRRACKAATQLEFETSSLFSLEESQNLSISQTDTWISIPDGSYIVTEEHTKDILSALDVVHSSLKGVVSLYCSSFRPGYYPTWDNDDHNTRDISSTSDPLKIKVCALHRLNEPELRKYDTLQLEVCVYYGGQVLSRKAYSPHAKITKNFFGTVVWDKWLNMGIALNSLPRESRVLFTLHGLELPGSGYKWTRTPIAWAAIRLFDNRGDLMNGSNLLSLWLGEEPDPLDSPYSDMYNQKNMLLQVMFDNGPSKLRFPDKFKKNSRSNHPGPPPNVQRLIKAIAEKDRFLSITTGDLNIVWANRFSCSTLLQDYPRGLPVVLLSTTSWSSTQLTDIWSILLTWPCSDPTYGLELLDAQFADVRVREKATEYLSQLSNDDLCDFLPQLVQSLRHDCYQNSAMAKLLLSRALESKRIAHYLYWHLRLMLVADIKFHQRFFMMLRALNTLVGEELYLEFNTQVELVEQLCAIAKSVKSTRDSHRQTILVEKLKHVADLFVGTFRLPLDSALLARGIDLESCSFFNSNTVPLKLSFLNADTLGDNINVIYKVGDDLRQDILVLQMIRLMEKIWLRAGLDLKMVTYQCVATGMDEGMLEMVSDSATLRAIQMEHGLTGSFKEKPLSEWLMRHNPSESAYKQAVRNFTLSCAGYCVATYVLGICDRHNDNIMVKKSGHMFHIDFGKILGNAQMFGSIKRDRAPFVLTPDMAYVINDGDKPTSNFQKFTDLCCTAYNELRKHSTLFISLLSLMLSSGLPELSSLDDVQYVRDALLPEKSDAAATYAFTKYIEDSLGSLATQINFFIHNLAQFKFSSPANAPALLSFCPRAYSIATDGKIQSGKITGYHKKFYPEMHYVYQIVVDRCDSDQHPTTVVFRRYREFHELHSKLMQCFPTETLPQLPGKIYIPGKSHTRQTSERRQVDLNSYLKALITMVPRISESDIIYTFFHCLMRDEVELAKLQEEVGEPQDTSSGGKIKVELSYIKKQQILSVMVRHVRDLVPRESCETADPYVKLYLLPDRDKSTKQKTKIAKKTLHPTYNETFSYAMTQSSLNHRQLQLSIWDASNVLSRQCLCSTVIELANLQTQLTHGATVADWFELQSAPDR